MKKLIQQILKFGIVGVICTIIDFGVTILLKEVFHTWYLFANGAGFTVSVVVNYILSMKYVFRGKKGANKIKEFIIFAVLSIIGLLLSELIMWIAVDRMQLHYVLSKVGATALVMIFNFVTRKIFLEDHSRPEEADPSEAAGRDK